MKAKFKCSCCESTKFFYIDPFADDRKRERDIGGRATCRRGVFNYQYSSTVKTGIKMDINTQAEAYICQNCGHVEFFATKLLDKIKKDEKTFKTKIKTLKAELKLAKERIMKLIKERDNLHTEFFGDDCSKYDHRDYIDRRKGLNNDIMYLAVRIDEIEKAINDYTSYLKCVSEIRFK